MRRLKITEFAYAAALIPSVVLAAPAYVGQWAAEGLGCDESITIVENELAGLERSCRFDSVDEDGRSFVVQATCSSEGEEYTTSFVLEMLGDDTLSITYVDNAQQTIMYKRCSKLIDY